MCELVVKGTCRSEPCKARIELAPQASFIEMVLIVRAVLLTDAHGRTGSPGSAGDRAGTHSPDRANEIQCTAS
jgi:hypothetical protein